MFLADNHCVLVEGSAGPQASSVAYAKLEFLPRDAMLEYNIMLSSCVRLSVRLSVTS